MPAMSIYPPDFGGTCFSSERTEQFFKLSYTIAGNTIRMRDYTGTDKIAKVNQKGARRFFPFRGDGEQWVSPEKPYL
jgi:hypothetical protein